DGTEIVTESSGVDQLDDRLERGGDRRIGPGIGLAGDDLLEHALAADAVGEVLDVHQLRPHARAGQGDRGDPGRGEGRHGVHQLVPGGGRGDRVLLEQRGAVVEDHRLGVVVGTPYCAPSTSPTLPMDSMVRESTSSTLPDRSTTDSLAT